MTRGEMERRLVRYADLNPCRNAFVDSRTPGSESKENFTIIGPGVAENPEQYVHIKEPHGFNIGAARQPPRCVNSQHSHETAEVFVVHSGRWAFRTGERGRDAEAILGPGDAISIPVRVFRGFENIGDDVGFLFAVLGGDDPGRVTWAPYVFDAAREFGLVLLENGQLVDTRAGQSVPEGIAPMKPTTADEVASFRRVSSEDLRACVVSAESLRSSPASVVARQAAGTVEESAVIGAASEAEGVPAGKMSWPHGFQVRRLLLAPGAAVEPHQRREEEVLLMHRGTLRLEWGADALDLGPGDVMTVPRQLRRGFRNASAEPAIAYVVRGSDSPAPPEWNGRG